MTKVKWAALCLALSLLASACGGKAPQAADTTSSRPASGNPVAVPPATDAPAAIDSTSTASNGMPANIEVIGDDEPFMEGGIEAELEADMDNFLDDLDKELENESKNKDKKAK